MRLVFLVGMVLAQAVAAWAATAPDPVFPDVKALSSTALNARVLKTVEQDGLVIEEVMYHSEMDGEKSVDMFAYFGYPKGAKRLPAFVWNQAGLAKASTDFVVLGAKRGYAVLCIDLPIPGYRSTGDYPIKTTALFVGDDPQKAPLAHAGVALLKAVTFLESRTEVDPDRIGMAGSSWGGFLTTLMVGVDPRLKVGSCFFGTGNLQLGCEWFDGACKDPAYAERWRTTLDPAWRLSAVKTPISWCTGTNDTYYWMPALMKTLEMAGGPRHLGLIANWDHGLPPEMDDEVLGYLDTHLQKQPPFPQVTPVTVAREGDGLTAKWSFTTPAERKVVSADLMLSYGGPGNWRRRDWLTLPAKVAGQNCAVALPPSSWPCFISGAVVEANGYRHSTPLLLVDPAGPGMKGPVPAIDSLADWGTFEAGLPAYLPGYAKPQTSPDAHSGNASMLLKPGRTAFPPINFIAGQRYRLNGYLKADRATTVTVQLSGRFDAIRRSEERAVDAGTAWTQFSFDYQTEQAMTTDLALVIIAPKERVVLLDDVSFRPIAVSPP